MSIQWRGGINLDFLEETLKAAALEGAERAAEHVLTESRKVVPIEEGTLERSGRTSAEQQPGKAVAAVSYDTPYAVRQHEDTTLRHDQGRTAKYLERPLHSEADTVRGIVAQTMREALK